VAAPNSSPWRRADVLALPLPYAIALACLLLAWLDGSRSLTVAQQMDPLNLGIAGVIVAGAANTIWLGGGRRRVALRRERLRRLVAGQCGEPQTAARPEAAGSVVGLPGGRRYHRPGCALVRGKPVAATGRDGRLPCGVCCP
jgi:RNase P/RNase MRP subunit p29